MRNLARPTVAVASATDLCLVVVQNKTAEPLHVLLETQTPRGPVFLDTAVADLEPGGVCSCAAPVAADLMLYLPGGAHRLALRGGELRFLPGSGLRQRQQAASYGLPVRWTLLVDIEADVASYDHVLPLLGDVLGERLQDPTLQQLFGGEYPPHCTVFLPKLHRPGVPRDRYVVPEALFFVERRSAQAVALDGSRVSIAPAGTGLVVVIEAEEELRELRLHTDALPLRCSERFQVVYLEI